MFYRENRAFLNANFGGALKSFKILDALNIKFSITKIQNSFCVFYFEIKN